MTESSSSNVRPQIEADLAAALAQMGGVLLSAQTVETAVALVTDLAVATIPGTVGAGVTLVDEHGQRTAAASDPLVEQADALQYEFGTGPCLTAWQDRVRVRVDDLAVETRWPQWTAAAAALDLRSILSVPMVADGAVVGAIKVYSREPGVYQDHAEHVLELFARQAGILLANTRTMIDAQQLTAQLTEALTNRDAVGQAKGVLLARGAADDQTAFLMLVAASRRSGVQLHEVAHRLVASVTTRSTDPSSTT